MVFQFVLHLVFEENKLQTTPVTVEGLVYLGTENFKLKDTSTSTAGSLHLVFVRLHLVRVLTWCLSRCCR